MSIRAQWEGQRRPPADAAERRAAMTAQMRALARRSAANAQRKRLLEALILAALGVAGAWGVLTLLG